jgi:rod shape-determining protein MreD
MGYFIAIPILAILAVLQNSILGDFRIFYGQAELILMAVLAWSWYAEQNEAIFWAFVGGILQDVLNPVLPLGTSVIAMLIMVFVIKTIERNFYQVSIFALIGFVSLGSFLHHIILFLVFTSQNYTVPFVDYFQNFSIPTIGFNLIGTLPIYFILRRIQKRLPRRQSPWEVTAR